ncbi:hypothetical protein PAPYR_7294 [Paratrimastix pyriformis]|uniref:Uncharacterized protein n=1 Tax=Paratrimastix pyriformis TaxID=342808 RepID=A0ABQ8UDC2_9EUKA|nr:hypothetical protein PAPYR_7294 [Paratrimastix pyriformis]
MEGLDPSLFKDPDFTAMGLADDGTGDLGDLEKISDEDLLAELEGRPTRKPAKTPSKPATTAIKPKSPAPPTKPKSPAAPAPPAAGVEAPPPVDLDAIMASLAETDKEPDGELTDADLQDHDLLGQLAVLESAHAAAEPEPAEQTGEAIVPEGDEDPAHARVAATLHSAPTAAPPPAAPAPPAQPAASKGELVAELQGQVAALTREAQQLRDQGKRPEALAVLKRLRLAKAHLAQLAAQGDLAAPSAPAPAAPVAPAPAAATLAPSPFDEPAPPPPPTQNPAATPADRPEAANAAPEPTPAGQQPPEGGEWTKEAAVRAYQQAALAVRHTDTEAARRLLLSAKTIAAQPWDPARPPPRPNQLPRPTPRASPAPASHAATPTPTPTPTATAGAATQGPRHPQRAQQRVCAALGQQLEKQLEELRGHMARCQEAGDVDSLGQLQAAEAQDSAALATVKARPSPSHPRPPSPIRGPHPFVREAEEAPIAAMGGQPEGGGGCRVAMGAVGGVLPAYQLVPRQMTVELTNPDIGEAEMEVEVVQASTLAATALEGLYMIATFNHPAESPQSFQSAPFRAEVATTKVGFKCRFRIERKPSFIRQLARRKARPPAHPPRPPARQPAPPPSHPIVPRPARGIVGHGRGGDPKRGRRGCSGWSSLAWPGEIRPPLHPSPPPQVTFEIWEKRFLFRHRLVGRGSLSPGELVERAQANYRVPSTCRIRRALQGRHTVVLSSTAVVFASTPLPPALTPAPVPAAPAATAGPATVVEQVAAEDEFNPAEGITSSAVIEAAKAECAAWQAQCQSRGAPVPEEVAMRLQALETQEMILMTQIQAGTLTPALYAERLVGVIEAEKKNALQLKATNRPQALHCLQRAKLMQGEVDEIRQAIASGQA